MSFEELAALAVPAEFLFGVGALPAEGSVTDGVKPDFWKYIFMVPELLRL
ncbi:MAG: hypothetical protein QMC48_00710 [SAR324 cluster bacterium]